MSSILTFPLFFFYFSQAVERRPLKIFEDQVFLSTKILESSYRPDSSPVKENQAPFLRYRMSSAVERRSLVLCGGRWVCYPHCLLSPPCELWGLQFYSAKVLLQMSFSGSFCPSPHDLGDGATRMSGAQGQDFYSVSFRPVNPSMEYVPF